MFADLEKMCSSLKMNTVEERVEELTTSQKGVYVVSIGGFRVSTDNDVLIWCGQPVTEKRIQTEIREGLGTSALLTYMNKSNLSAKRLGDICLERGHDWGLHWMSLSLLFVGYDLEVELAFSRDKRFFMSWPVTKVSTGGAFVVNGSLKHWAKFLCHRDDKDYDRASRDAMNDAHRLFQQLMPTAHEGHFLITDSYHKAALKRLPLEGKSVVEIGVGHGELTKLILEHPVKEVIGFEIQKGICTLKDTRFRLIEKDVRSHTMASHSFCLIANPPYDLLPWIRDEVIDHFGIVDILMLIPERARSMFLPEDGYEHICLIPGIAFSPPSNGNHLLIKRGFSS